MFYTYGQNNSGGYFLEDADAGVAEWIIIEADSENDADVIFDRIAEEVHDMYDFCECCGTRWSGSDNWKGGDEVPMVYHQPLEEVLPETRNRNAYVHYLNGKVRYF